MEKQICCLDCSDEEKHHYNYIYIIKLLEILFQSIAVKSLGL